MTSNILIWRTKEQSGIIDRQTEPNDSRPSQVDRIPQYLERILILRQRSKKQKDKKYKSELCSQDVAGGGT